jgi:hypothetical protein
MDLYMNNTVLLGLIVLFLALAVVILLVTWSCRIIESLNTSGEKTAREIIKGQKNES